MPKNTVRVLSIVSAVITAAVVAWLTIAPPTCLRHAGKIAFAQRSVSDKLKSPATAKFPLNEYTIKPSQPGMWGVFGYVDSQNQFGALIRTHWLVVMQRDGSSWKAVEVTLDNTGA